MGDACHVSTYVLENDSEILIVPEESQDMKHFFNDTPGETREEERLALLADMLHLRDQCQRYECENNSVDSGGVAGLMLRERARMFEILHTM